MKKIYYQRFCGVLLFSGKSSIYRIQAPSHRWDFFQSFFFYKTEPKEAGSLKHHPEAGPKSRYGPWQSEKNPQGALEIPNLERTHHLNNVINLHFRRKKVEKKIPQIFHVPKKKIPRKSSSLPQSQSYRAYRYRAKQGLASLAASRWNSD